MPRFLAILALLLGCGHKPDLPPNPYPVPIADVLTRFSAMSDGGWVVSRWDDGRRERLGDSLIWTGIAMAALPCDEGEALESALQSMLRTTGGHLYRHPSLPEEWSLDGALGLYYGVWSRVKRCNSRTWSELITQHAQVVPLPPKFDVVRNQLLFDLGAGDEPSAEDRGALGAEIAGWALADVAQAQVGYRLHLGYLALAHVDAPRGKVAYCEAVKPAKMPLLEHFCGRGSLGSWAQDFRYDAWEYAFQRSPAWESPDGVPGLHTPAVDYLLAAELLSQQ